MVTYAFRGVDSLGKPTGVFGFATAPNMKELFWEIDQYLSPNDVQLMRVDRGGVCFTYSDETEETDDFEVSATVLNAAFDDTGWKTPKWVDPYK